MAEIRPLDLPSAASVQYGRGDVRHFSEGDAVDVPGLQVPTRQLAERDNLLAAKVNEVVQEVNNKEQFVPLSIPRTAMSPGAEEIVCNFKIPAGFEARVLNAAIGSTPASSALTLKILYASGYANTSGTELVSTSSTFDSGVAFYNDGEFIVSIRNSGSAALEAAISVTLTIRPIGSTAGLLVGSVIQGAKGYAGRDGGPGQKGDPGVGGAGSPGMVWSSTYNALLTYVPPQVVKVTSSGVTSSYIAITSVPPGNPPPNSTYWDVVVEATGSPGSSFRLAGTWNSTGTYVNNSQFIDVVSIASGSNTSSYACVLTNYNHQPPSATYWQLMSGPGSGETPTYNVGDLSTSMPFTATVTGTATGIYGAVAASGSLACREFSVVNSVGTYKGLVFIYGQFHINLPAACQIDVTLPTSQAKPGDPWTNSEVFVSASVHGSNPVESGSLVRRIDMAKPSSSVWRLTNLATGYEHVAVAFFGMKIK